MRSHCTHSIVSMFSLFWKTVLKGLFAIFALKTEAEVSLHSVHAVNQCAFDTMESV